MMNISWNRGFNLLRFDKWNMFFLDAMESSSDEVIVAVKKRGRGVGGWSSKNPCLKVGCKPTKSLLAGKPCVLNAFF